MKCSPCLLVLTSHFIGKKVSVKLLARKQKHIFLKNVKKIPHKLFEVMLSLRGMDTVRKIMEYEDTFNIKVS